jgi:hypothetical protein
MAEKPSAIGSLLTVQRALRWQDRMSYQFSTFGEIREERCSAWAKS